MCFKGPKSVWDARSPVTRQRSSACITFLLHTDIEPIFVVFATGEEVACPSTTHRFCTFKESGL